MVPVDGLTHGHVFALGKKAGLPLRYSELGSVWGEPVEVVPSPPKLEYQICERVTKS